MWQLKAGEARVYLPDGNAAPHAEKIGGYREVPVKILLNHEIAVVETAGQRVYAGPHQLSADHARYVGVRFRRRAGDKADSIGVVSVTLQKP